MKTRLQLALDITFLGGDGGNSRVDVWMVDSLDGYVNAGWVFHQPPTRDILTNSIHRKIHWNRIEDQRIAELLGLTQL